MIEQNRPLRKVGIPDHVWDSFDQMAQDMGADRDSLISQALFMFARLNGYLAPGATASPAAAEMRGASVVPSVPTVGPSLAPPPAPRLKSESMEGPPRRITGSVSRAVEPPPPVADDPVRREVAERVLETAAELERLMKDKNQSDAGREDSQASGHAQSAEGKELYLVGEDGGLEKVIKERFVIGRGKHCDLVINSGKVSREHAAIIRESGEHFIEDLGSSNGTWFNKARIRRRKIEDGDEFFICSEKVKCVIR